MLLVPEGIGPTLITYAIPRWSLMQIQMPDLPELPPYASSKLSFTKLVEGRIHLIVEQFGGGFILLLGIYSKGAS